MEQFIDPSHKEWARIIAANQENINGYIARNLKKAGIEEDLPPLEPLLYDDDDSKKGGNGSGGNNGGGMGGGSGPASNLPPPSNPVSASAPKSQSAREAEARAVQAAKRHAELEAEITVVKLKLDEAQRELSDLVSQRPANNQEEEKHQETDLDRSIDLSDNTIKELQKILTEKTKEKDKLAQVLSGGKQKKDLSTHRLPPQQDLFHPQASGSSLFDALNGISPARVQGSALEIGLFDHPPAGEDPFTLGDHLEAAADDLAQIIEMEERADQQRREQEAGPAAAPEEEAGSDFIFKEVTDEVLGHRKSGNALDDVDMDEQRVLEEQIRQRAANQAQSSSFGFPSGGITGQSVGSFGIPPQPASNFAGSFPQTSSAYKPPISVNGGGHQGAPLVTSGILPILPAILPSPPSKNTSQNTSSHRPPTVAEQHRAASEQMQRDQRIRDQHHAKSSSHQRSDGAHKGPHNTHTNGHRQHSGSHNNNHRSASHLHRSHLNGHSSHSGAAHSHSHPSAQSNPNVQQQPQAQPSYQGFRPAPLQMNQARNFGTSGHLQQGPHSQRSVDMIFLNSLSIYAKGTQSNDFLNKKTLINQEQVFNKLILVA